MAMVDNQKIVSQREIFEKCADIVNDPAAKVEHTTDTPHYHISYKDKKIFEIYRCGSVLHIEINYVMFDSLTGENRKFVSDLYDRVVAKYVEQENSRNRNVLNFLNSFTLGKQKQ